MKIDYAFLSLITFIMLTAGCSKVSYEPVKTYNSITIKDGEYLQYGKFNGGEKQATIVYVDRISNDEVSGPVLVQYLDAERMDQSDYVYKIHTNYMDFPSRKIISLRTGSLEEMLYNWPDFTNKKTSITKSDPYRYLGEFYRFYRLNGDRMDMETRTWDGKSVKILKSREPVKAGYPIIDADTMLFSVRFLDYSNPGIFYVIMPAVLKEPISGYFKFLGKERIKIGLGEFDAIKLGIAASDPFLGKLLDTYAKDTVFWVEESDRKLILKLKSTDVTMELEKISNVMRPEKN